MEWSQLPTLHGGSGGWSAAVPLMTPKPVTPWAHAFPPYGEKTIQQSNSYKYLPIRCWWWGGVYRCCFGWGVGFWNPLPYRIGWCISTFITLKSPCRHHKFLANNDWSLLSYNVVNGTKPPITCSKGKKKCSIYVKYIPIHLTFWSLMYLHLLSEFQHHHVFTFQEFVKCEMVMIGTSL